MRRIHGNWDLKGFDVHYGTYDEKYLLYGEGKGRRRGLNKQCPACQEWNYITFRECMKDKDGNRIISQISWVTCSKCGLAYGLE